MTTVTLGQAVPDFTAQSSDGPFALSRFRGKTVALYFYPKDNTPGCTTESQDFRDLHQDFLAAGCQVVGVSRDTLKSHESFRTRQSLPFPLIADTDEAVCALFDVIKMKNMYGKQVRGIQRSTFLIDAEGRLVQEWRNVKVAGHAAAVLQSVRDLG